MTIYILHQNRYWTEYVKFLLNDKKNFKLVASQKAIEGYDDENDLEHLEVFNPSKHNIILTPGRLHEPTYKNKIIMRFGHSPGFFVYPLLRAYADLIKNHTDSEYRFLVNQEYYKSLILKELNDDSLDHFKYLLLNDPKVKTLGVDVNMVGMKHAPKVAKRQKGSCLLSLTWLLVDNDFSTFLTILKKLGSVCQLNILLHPLMRMDKRYLQEVKKLEGTLYQKAYFNLTREELVDVYDEHEYIVSDGSGSCYEAILRGCKPYAVHGMRSVTKDESFNEILDEEYFPFPSYELIGKEEYPSADIFIDKYFPYVNTMNLKQAITLAQNEIFHLDFL